MFKHPGVLVSRAQLDFVRANLDKEPWRTAWSKLQRHSYASLSYTAAPRADVNCGGNSIPDNGCSDEREDAMAAYTHALQWYLTKDSRYAKKAIQIMDAWSAVITKHTGSNAPLQTGWAGANFSRAAELIKHTYGGWSQAARFAGKLRTVYLPTLIAGRPDNNGNWELIMTDAAIGIAVHLDDRASFNKAIATWRGRLPAYIYLTTDGSIPKAPPGSTVNTKAEIIDYWYDQTKFVDGLTQETCRDFWHTGWGLAAISHVAETAHHQGVDLYATAKHRLRRAMDLHAKIQLGGTVPTWLCGGEVKRDLGNHYEVAYNALHNRLGYNDFPNAAKWVEQKRPMGPSHFLGWETLTHAQNPASSSVESASVYGAMPDGKLTYTAIDAATGQRTRGAFVSTTTLGFIPKAMATLDFNTLLVTEKGPEGRLYRVDVRSNRDSLIFEKPVYLGSGFTHDLLAYDGNGHLFGIADGTLRRYTVNAVKPTIDNISGGSAIGDGFTLKTLTATGPGWILGTTADGKLISYQINGPGSWRRYELRDATWQVFDHLLSPGGGVYYGHRSDGSLLRYVDQNPYDGQGDDLSSQSAVGTEGWTQTLLSAQPATVS
ncbi:alginate lyase family protein [Nonomuraea solani]|uniref:alginate lyase family protein n=1 Tax=Nonomuraea solani TaxID=1144553 RepID=UPI00190EE7D0|nr:alginate lyase family protein [Nonomuraea solani]